MELTFEDSSEGPISQFLQRWIDQIKSAPASKWYAFLHAEKDSAEGVYTYNDLGAYNSIQEACEATREQFPGCKGIVVSVNPLGGEIPLHQSVSTVSDEELLEIAIGLAVEGHKGQRDRAGKPYILHCLYVMDAVETIREKIVAVLHDLFEDTAFTPQDLRDRGFPEEIIHSLSLLTRFMGETRLQQAKRIVDSGDEVALNVKLADNKHNSCLDRIANPTARDHERVAEYAEVRAYLQRFGKELTCEFT